MQNYKDLVIEVLGNGEHKVGRNGATFSVWGKQLEYDLTMGFPIVTGRRIYYNGVMGELAALLKGKITHISDLKDEGCHYWDKFADKDGAIRLAYGNAWRDFNGTDQIARLIEGLKEDPNSRRHLITGWDPANLENLSSQCCHYAYQWRVTQEKYLDMVWVQRSVDVMIGLPSDIIFAAAFLMVVANTVDLIPHRLVLQLGDVHIYEEHVDSAEKYLTEFTYMLPTARISDFATVDSFSSTMFKLHNYEHGPKLDFEMKL